MADRPPPDADLMSLVIPVYNERESLPALLAEIDAAVAPLGRRVEVIFVDDGSRDGSWDVIRDLAAKDSRVRGVRFRRNFGKAAALEAGFGRAAGGIVFTLDADLQDDPKEIPKFLDALAAGKDVVSGWKKVRHDPWHKVLPSRVFNGMLSVVTGVKLHDHNCGFKAYRGEVTRAVRLYGELHRFVPVLAAAKGYRVGEVVVEHRARKFGHSKFGARRFIKGFLDLLSVRFTTEFGRRPMHLLGTVAVVAAALGALGLFVLLAGEVGLWAAGYGGLSTAELAVGAVLSVGALLFAAQAGFSGLLAELLVAKTAADAEPFDVSEQTG